MVKVVVGDEIQLKLAEDRLTQSGFTAQVGLVIGKFSSQLDRGFVFDLVPTPLNDAGEPACSVVDTKDDKKRTGSKSKPQVSDASTLLIDMGWVAEHARQVSRMLVGGMNVVGVYVWVSDTSFKNSTITLCQLLQTVQGVAEAAPILEGGLDQRLLLHISYSPRRWTCRNCMLSSSITSSSIRPCDFKLGKVLNSVQRFRCIYNFELRLPISGELASNGSTLSAVLRHGISTVAKQLRGAKAIIDGNLIKSDEPCTTDRVHEVELLLPFTESDPSIEACSRKDVDGLLVFGGSVSSFTYLNTKEPVSQAVADIKFDIVRSLQSRLDMICDEDLAEKDEGPEEASQDKPSQKPISRLVLHSLRKTCRLAFPRRVFLPWLGDIYLCDYLQPSETLEVIKDHCVELMSMQSPNDSSKFVQPEEEAPPSVISRSFWDAMPGNDDSYLDNKREVGASADSSIRQTAKSFNFSLVAALFILFISILIGFVLVRKS
ncbi:Protein odr-4 homolog [Linum grandiflorum]